MSQTTTFPQLREQAIALRRAGRSRREIKELLGIGSNQTLNDALRGEPPQPWTWRPNAKDDLRNRARQLREQGHSYDQIVAELGVSKSTVSAWVCDMPRPDRLSYEECCKRQKAAVARYWATERPRRDAARAAVSASAAAEIGTLSDRETIIAGAVAYWCEGGKNKPHRRADRVSFTNSDPALIGLFLRFLHLSGIATDQIIFRVYVHESADARAAERFWREVTHGHADRFRRPTLKRHNPRTVRKNVGADYHGCLRIDVQRSAGLYRKIEGWAAAAMAVVDGPAEVGTAATLVERTDPST
jgi:transcriptional regulator with XRE-family HTH domain